MSLKLHGESDTTIMKIDWWSSLTFLMYIHDKIGHISKGLAQTMSIPIPFLNISAIKTWGSTVFLSLSHRQPFHPRPPKISTYRWQLLDVSHWARSDTPPPAWDDTNGLPPLLEGLGESSKGDILYHNTQKTLHEGNNSLIPRYFWQLQKSKFSVDPYIVNPYY